MIQHPRTSKSKFGDYLFCSSQMLETINIKYITLFTIMQKQFTIMQRHNADFKCIIKKNTQGGQNVYCKEFI